MLTLLNRMLDNMGDVALLAEQVPEVVSQAKADAQ
jgi:hypothetical protein